MTRLAIIGATVLIGGCATMTGEPPPPPPPAAAPNDAQCDADAAGGLIGREASQELAVEALRLTGARTVRWLPPGAIVTMDYRFDRLNISLDDRNAVTGFTCG